MGCSHSSGVIQSHLYQKLTEKQITIVRSSWEKVNTDYEGTGIIVFRKLFEDYPEYIPLFTEIVEDEDEEHMMLSERMLKNHAFIVMEALGYAVDNIYDSEAFSGALQSIGASHSKNSISVNMLQKMWPAIDHTMSQKLGAQYNTEHRTAWKSVFSFITSKMAEGMMENPDKAVPLSKHLARQQDLDIHESSESSYGLEVMSGETTGKIDQSETEKVLDQSETYTDIQIIQSQEKELLTS